MDISEDQRRKWHIEKGIPIATLVALLAQTGGVIWWAASTSAKVDFMKESNIAAQIVQTAVDRKQDEEAKRTEDRVLQQLDKVNQKLDRLMEQVASSARR